VQKGTSVGTERTGPRTSPTVAYLLLTHKEPDQVERLAARILSLSPTGHLVVHHDLKAGTLPWDGSPPPRVHLVDERVTVEWGDWSIVEATLRMFQFAHEQLGADWSVVISGEHWPVMDLSEWETMLSSRGVDAYIPTQLLPPHLHFGAKDLDGNRFLARCVLRWFRFHRPKSHFAHRVLTGAAKVSRWTHPILKLEYSLRGESWFVGIPRRRGPTAGWDLYKGSEWITCSARATDILLRTDPAVAAWFRRSHIPDESYIQSVLRRPRDLVVRNTDVTWVPAEPTAPTPKWMLLTLDQLPAVHRADVPFARKVDPSWNPEVIARIDATVDARVLSKRTDDSASVSGFNHGVTHPLSVER
jgi:hypothetical protein